MVDNAKTGGRNADVEAVSESGVEKAPKATGRTSAAIDAVNCSDADPQIHIVNGRYDDDPGWSSGAFEDPNNEGIVIERPLLAQSGQW